MDARLRALRAPFGLPAEGALGSGKSRLPSKVNPLRRNCHQEDYLTAEQPDVAAVIDEVQLKCFNAKTETSPAADPATDFRPFANSPRSLANNFRLDTSLTHLKRRRGVFANLSDPFLSARASIISVIVRHAILKELNGCLLQLILFLY